MFSAKVVIFLAAVAVCYGVLNAKPSHKRLQIDGGTFAKIEDYPFLVSVQFCYLDFCDHICGGVIVNEKWVLTSSNCVSDPKKIIAIGTSNVDVLDIADLDIVDVEAAYRHPNYPVRGIGRNDIALLKLAQPLTFNNKVQPAKLPTQGQEFNGTAVATGYGLGFELNAALDLTLVSFDDCNRVIEKLIPYEDNPLDKDSNLCTLNEVSNNCAGDIGGPLSQDGTVIGLITWYFDKPCNTKGAPNVFTKLSNFADWIHQTITENS